jgi:hypothetical protein
VTAVRPLPDEVVFDEIAAVRTACGGAFRFGAGELLTDVTLQFAKGQDGPCQRRSSAAMGWRFCGLSRFSGL